jgi:hypothetical protein
MNSFLDPVGARPPVVYWRRRALVAAALAVVVMLLGKSCGGAAPDLRSRASGQGPVPLVSTYTPTPKPTEKIIDGGADALPGVHGGSSGGGGGIGSGAASGTGKSSGAGIGSGGAAGPAKPLAAVKPTKSPTPTPTAAAKTPSPAPTKTAIAVTTCKKSAIAVKLRTDHTTYAGRTTPQLFIAVKNVGDVGCLVDLGSKALTLVVKSGTDRIWSSDDCQGKGTSDVRLLKPGQALEARSIWSKVRSEPGCPKGMPQARPGTYLVEGSAGGVKAKKRAVFQLT